MILKKFSKLELTTFTFSMLGTFAVVSMNVNLQLIGFSAFLISNISSIFFMKNNKHYLLFIQKIIFACLSVYGIAVRFII